MLKRVQLVSLEHAVFLSPELVIDQCPIKEFLVLVVISVSSAFEFYFHEILLF